MRLFKKNDIQKNKSQNNTKLPMTGRVKKGFRFYCMVVMAMTVVLGSSVTAFAAGDPITVVNNLSDFIFGLVRAVGMIMLGFGIVQIGLVPEISRSLSESKWLSDPCRRRCDYFCKRDFDPYHRLSLM